MGNSTREDVNGLLELSGRQIGELRGLYEASLRSEAIPVAMRALIKNVLENQRSALEYVAHAMVEAHGRPGKNVYFPVVKEPSRFDERMESNMRGVAAGRPDLAAMIEAAQPYHPDNEWLGHLATLTNENKHQALTAQTRQEVTRISGGKRGGFFGLRGGPGIELGPGASIEMSGGASIEFSGPGQPFEQGIERTILVDWHFETVGVSALGLLELIQRAQPPLLNRLMAAADL